MTEHICRECRERIANGIASPYLKYFDWLAVSANETGAVTATTALAFWDNKDDLKGEYVAELVLRVRRTDTVTEDLP